MNDAARRLASVVLAALATPAAAAPVDKADICHWDANRARVSSVATSSVESHFAQHGDSYASQYFRDSDGDGFGDPAELTDRCPNVGYVTNNTDCNDADASLSPNATEVVGDGIDNDCDPLTLDDEACHASESSGETDTIEVNFTDLSENLCNQNSWTTFDSVLSNPSISTGGTVFVELIARGVLGAENPESPNADAYDASVQWEWISEAGEHVSVGPMELAASWIDMENYYGIGPGDYAEGCTADAVVVQLPNGNWSLNLPSGNWILWATYTDHEKAQTQRTCNPAIFTVL